VSFIRATDRSANKASGSWKNTAEKGIVTRSVREESGETNKRDEFCLSASFLLAHASGYDVERTRFVSQVYLYLPLALVAAYCLFLVFLLSCFRD
jgi:hypothetical protein